MEKLVKDINDLKKKKNAIILVHNYQRPEIYEVADFLGDSLDLAKKAASAEADIIVFCGVDFMAETAKILSPRSKVLLPAKNATCPMANMIDASQLREMKAKHPSAKVVSYVNSTAEVKAESDYCCTSMNALKIVNSIPGDIIFIPDKHMGEWIKKKTNRNIILYEGFCYVHAKIMEENVKLAKKNHPNAKVIAHPECPKEVFRLADHITGTGGMITYSKEDSAGEFIVATEEGMVNRLKLEVPGKKFYAVGGVCVNMKKITLEKVYDALKNEQFEIDVDRDISIKAKKAIDRMLEMS